MMKLKTTTTLVFCLVAGAFALHATGQDEGENPTIDMAAAEMQRKLEDSLKAVSYTHLTLPTKA